MLLLLSWTTSRHGHWQTRQTWSGEAGQGGGGGVRTRAMAGRGRVQQGC
jgi:hypothetical protein